VVTIKVSIRVRVRVSFTTGAVRSAILATAGLLVCTVSLPITFSGLDKAISLGMSECPGSDFFK